MSAPEIRNFPPSSVKINKDQEALFDDPQGSELYEGVILKSDKPDEVNKQVTVQVFPKFDKTIQVYQNSPFWTEYM